MSTAEIVLSILAVLWVGGWIATVKDTGGLDRGQPHQGSRIMAIAVLFLIWPLIAMAMSRSKH